LHDGNIVVSSGDDYELDVFDVKGKLARKIIKDCDFVRISDEDVKQRVPRVPEGRKLVVPKNFPAIRSLTTDDEGRIFVGTYENRGKSLLVHDVFDSAGRFVAAIALKGRSQVWRKQKLYTIEEDEDGYPFIKRYAAKWTGK
jgi:hypothetical protein